MPAAPSINNRWPSVRFRWKAELLTEPLSPAIIKVSISKQNSPVKRNAGNQIEREEVKVILQKKNTSKGFNQRPEQTTMFMETFN